MFSFGKVPSTADKIQQFCAVYALSDFKFKVLIKFEGMKRWKTTIGKTQPLIKYVYVTHSDRSKAVLLLWFNLIVLFVCFWFFFLDVLFTLVRQSAWKSCPPHLPLLLFLFYAVLSVCVPFPFGVWGRV